jgi:hypothetical protein
VASTIKIKRSTGSAVPTNLAFGELAYSSGSGKLYFGSSTDGTAVTISEVGGAYYADLLKVTAGTATASKAVILDSSNGISGLGTVSASSFVGALTGNASTATALETARTINGESFDGTSNISFGTDSVSEGTTNLYFTNERVDDRVADLIVAGSNITKTYDDVAGTLTIAATTDTSSVRSLFSATDAGGDGSFSYDSATGVFTYTGPSASEVRAHFSGGTGVSITDGVVAIGQSVGTTDNVTFNNVTVNGTLSSDDITAASVTVTGNAVITGDLTVQGTTTTVNSTAVAISDINLTLAKDATTAAQANGAGLTVAGAGATLTYVSSGDKWAFNKQVEANITGDLTGNADTATTLETARDFSVSGDVTTASAVSFNGSGNVDLAVTLTNSAVTTSKIADGAVTAVKMAAGSVELDTDTVTGTLPVSNGGTGATTFTAGNLLIGSGTDPVTTDSGLSWNSGTETLTVGGATLATGNDGTVTLSTSTANADIVIAPNGTGSVTLSTNSIIFDSDGDGIVESAAGDTMTIRGDAGLILESTTNGISMVLPAGTTSKVSISGPTPAQYSTNLADNDLVTANWVQNADLDGGVY